MDMKSLNPLNLLEKLINEHGSAAIRGDQIALLRDQLIATTKRLSVLEAENATLHEEKNILNQRTEDLTVFGSIRGPRILRYSVVFGVRGSYGIR